jgi:DNA (cytosine-5)-methyltransferase 1
MTFIEKTAADFFAGIGLASLGLTRQQWQVKYAVDHSFSKQQMYEQHFGPDHFHKLEIEKVSGHDLPRVSLAHASFPCTDISLAGSRGGIDAGESSAFWEFVRILKEMGHNDGPGQPPFVLIENVEGLISSGDGNDLRQVLLALNELGYSTDLLLINARHFVPQSRVRLFITGSLAIEPQSQLKIEEQLMKSGDVRNARIRSFIRNHADISWSIRDLPDLPNNKLRLDEIIDNNAEWWPEERTNYLLSQMFDRHKHEIERLKLLKTWSYRTAFRRMRPRDGKKQSTAEMRTDGIAGCLRTPKGGSARQIVLRIGRGQVNARLFNAKETARLMGADDFNLDQELSLNDALFGFGDAVCVPVMEWILSNYFQPAIVEYPNVIRKAGRKPVKSRDGRQNTGAAVGNNGRREVTGHQTRDGFSRRTST